MNRLKYFVNFHIFFALTLFPYILLLLAGIGIQSENIYNFGILIFILPQIIGIIGLALCISKRYENIGFTRLMAIVPVSSIVLFNFFTALAIYDNNLLSKNSHASWLAISSLILFSILNITLLTAKQNSALTHIPLCDIPKTIICRLSYITGYTLLIIGLFFVSINIESFILNHRHNNHIDVIPIIVAIIGLAILISIRYNIPEKIKNIIIIRWLINGEKSENN